MIWSGVASDLRRPEIAGPGGEPDFYRKRNSCYCNKKFREIGMKKGA